MKYREAARKLAELGCQEIPRRGGDLHRKWFNPATGRIGPLPDWSNADLKLGTVRAVVRQLGLEWDIFKES